LLFALSSEVARTLSESFQADEVEKTYQAVVRGYAPEVAHIDYPLKEILDKFSDKDANPDKPAQEAVSDLMRLATTELPFPSGRYQASRYSLVQLTPKTGRKHQLRRHMAHIRHPIIGDTNHGDGKQNKAAREHLELDRLALVARQLSFPHPTTGQTLTINAGLDEALTKLYRLCGWEKWC
jgi:tRNA pseudouridine65 synthase